MKFYRLFFLLLVAGCGPSEPPGSRDSAPARFEMTGKLESRELLEASGMQAGNNGVFFIHNDDGNRIFATDATGRNLGEMAVKNAGDKDWEDITRVMGDEGPLLVIADTGDNLQTRKKTSLYFIPEPPAGHYDGDLKVHHKLDVRYPDGPHDVEAVAYDSSSDMILFLTKRDKPPRLYGIPLDLALWEEDVEAVFLAEVPGFRPPTRMEILGNPKRGMWISQPTGMDISSDGRTAAVITYRSLYFFRRQDNETWAAAFQRTPEEYIGPPGYQDEAVAFGHDTGTVFVTAEGRHAPVYRLDYLESTLRQP
ncbi:hypothetical protein ACFL00_01735 [Pseudomonadota bacterium]